MMNRSILVHAVITSSDESSFGRDARQLAQRRRMTINTICNAKFKKASIFPSIPNSKLTLTQKNVNDSIPCLSQIQHSPLWTSCNLTPFAYALFCSQCKKSMLGYVRLSEPQTGALEYLVAHVPLLILSMELNEFTLRWNWSWSVTLNFIQLNTDFCVTKSTIN